MFILIGTKLMLSIKGESIDAVTCDHCGQVARWQYKKGMLWLTLFFIPIIPLFFTKQEWIMCPSCGHGVKVTDENRERFMSTIRLI